MTVDLKLTFLSVTDTYVARTLREQIPHSKPRANALSNQYLLSESLLISISDEVCCSLIGCSLVVQKCHECSQTGLLKKETTCRLLHFAHMWHINNFSPKTKDWCWGSTGVQAPVPSPLWVFFSANVSLVRMYASISCTLFHASLLLCINFIEKKKASMNFQEILFGSIPWSH